MKNKTWVRRQEIRYSEAFKMEVVRAPESEGETGFDDLAMKYGIKGKTTVARWVRQYGNGTRGTVIRVERPGEINEVERLTARVRRLEEALADANIDAALERAYTRIACRRAGIADVAEFKKSRWPAGHEAVELEGRKFGVSVSGCARRVGITRQNYYARRQARQRRVVEAELVVALVLEERKVQPRLGLEAAFYAQRRAGPGRGELGAGPVCGSVAGQRPAGGTQAGGISLHDQFPSLSAGVYQPDQGVDGEPTQRGLGGRCHLPSDGNGVCVLVVADRQGLAQGGGAPLQRFPGDRRVPGGAENGAGGVASRSEAHPSFRSRNPVLFA